MTKIAFAAWNGAISPVFDSAQQAILYDFAAKESSVHTLALPADGPGKLIALEREGANTLVCGAISRSLAGIASSHGLRLIPFTLGALADVVEGYRQNRLEDSEFRMPGVGDYQRSCCRWYDPDGNTISQPKINNQGASMPAQDGTGPQGKGPGSGRGLGPCNGLNGKSADAGSRARRARRARGAGRGQGNGRNGRGKGRNQ